MVDTHLIVWLRAAVVLASLLSQVRSRAPRKPDRHMRDLTVGDTAQTPVVTAGSILAGWIEPNELLA